jgi:uncharacterized protein (DUF849 family)
MMNGVWLEAALNGPWSRDKQPLIPLSVDELVADGIACARAGASIIHVHAYDETTGRQKDDPDLYARIIEGIRAVEDVIVYPTIPFAGSGETPAGTAAARFAAIEDLAKRGLLEWAVVDPGSVNVASYADLSAGREGFVYLNPESHVRHGLSLAATYGFAPSYAVYEPGFLRLGAALARTRDLPMPPVYRFMFSEAFTFGFPPEPYALAAYRALAEREAPSAPWMIAGLGVDIRALIPAAVAVGGHVRVGLEDAPFGSDLSNVAWVESAAEAIRATGGAPATADEVRAEMKRRR